MCHVLCVCKCADLLTGSMVLVPNLKSEHMRIYGTREESFRSELFLFTIVTALCYGCHSDQQAHCQNHSLLPCWHTYAVSNQSKCCRGACRPGRTSGTTKPPACIRIANAGKSIIKAVDDSSHLAD